MIGVIFWSGTGNTERMAYEVAEGIKAAGQEVEVKSVSEVSVDEAAAYEKLALGCADTVSYTHLKHEEISITCYGSGCVGICASYWFCSKYQVHFK